MNFLTWFLEVCKETWYQQEPQYVRWVSVQKDKSTMKIVVELLESKESLPKLNWTEALSVARSIEILDHAKIYEEWNYGQL